MEVPSYANDPKRFLTQPVTLFVDRFMTGFIKVGGALVITAVLGIFVFILLQIFPLFQSAKVAEVKSVPLPEGSYSVLGIDEWGGLPFLIETNGRIVTANLQTGEIAEVPSPFDASKQLSAVSYNEREQRVIVGTADGLFSLASMKYSAVGDGEKRRSRSHLTPNRSSPSGHPARRYSLSVLATLATGSSSLPCRRSTGRSSFTSSRLARKRSLMGGGKLQVDKTYELSSMLTGQPVQVLVPATADAVIVLNSDGSVNYLFLKPDKEFEVRQTFTPFEDAEDPAIAVHEFPDGRRLDCLFQREWEQPRFQPLYSERRDQASLWHAPRVPEAAGDTRIHHQQPAQ